MSERPAQSHTGGGEHHDRHDHHDADRVDDRPTSLSRTAREASEGTGHA